MNYVRRYNLKVDNDHAAEKLSSCHKQLVKPSLATCHCRQNGDIKGKVKTMSDIKMWWMKTIWRENGVKPTQGNLIRIQLTLSFLLVVLFSGIDLVPVLYICNFRKNNRFNLSKHPREIHSSSQTDKFDPCLFAFLQRDEQDRSLVSINDITLLLQQQQQRLLTVHINVPIIPHWLKTTGSICEENFNDENKTFTEWCSILKSFLCKALHSKKLYKMIKSQNEIIYKYLIIKENKRRRLELSQEFN